MLTLLTQQVVLVQRTGSQWNLIVVGALLLLLSLGLFALADFWMQLSENADRKEIDDQIKLARRKTDGRRHL